MSTNRAGPPTHAGAVVWRADADLPRFLLVTAKGADDEWVLPKGRIEEGETPARTAAREVEEETGLGVDVGVELGMEVFTAKGSTVVCTYFLAQWTPEDPRASAGDVAAGEASKHARRAGVATAHRVPSTPAPEGRSAVWLPLPRAIARSTFPAGRRALEHAGKLLGL